MNARDREEAARDPRRDDSQNATGRSPPNSSHAAAGTWCLIWTLASYSVLDQFEAVKDHFVGKTTRVCGPCDRKIQTELRFDDGISN